MRPLSFFYPFLFSTIGNHSSLSFSIFLHYLLLLVERGGARAAVDRVFLPLVTAPVTAVTVVTVGVV
jgi:hypothetical protein